MYRRKVPENWTNHTHLEVGADLKRTPDGKWALIELEYPPGWRGLQYLTGLTWAERRNPLYVLDRHLANYGTALDVRSHFRRFLHLPPEEYSAEGNLHVLRTYFSDLFNGFIDNKTLIRAIMSGHLPEHSIPYLEWVPGLTKIDDLERFVCEIHNSDSDLINLETHPFIVVKPIDSACGDGVRIFLLKHGDRRLPRKLIKYFQKCTEPRIIEAFVPSAPFENEVTGNMHDACARMIFDFYINIDTFHSVNLFSEMYWRLASRPLNPYGTEEIEQFDERMFKANLSKGAIPKYSGQKEYDEAFDVVKKALGYVLQYTEYQRRRLKLVLGKNGKSGYWPVL